jgi:hypothetical protein
MGIDRRDFVVAAGETFLPTIRWATEVLNGVAITAITQAAPAVVTAVAHGVPNGWPVAIVSAKGMTQINSPRYPPNASNWHSATVMSVDTIKLNDVNSADFTAYLSGGFLVYNVPHTLSGMTVRMIIQDAPVNGTVLATLTIGSGITVDTSLFTITPRLETAALAWTVGYYDLEITDGASVIVQLISGTITIT